MSEEIGKLEADVIELKQELALIKHKIMFKADIKITEDSKELMEMMADPKNCHKLYDGYGYWVGKDSKFIQEKIK
jgi:hypothetical protein